MHRVTLRKIRMVSILLVIFLSFWLAPSKLLTFLIFLVVLGIAIVVIESRAPRKFLFNNKVTLFNWLIISGTNLFFTGAALISGASNSSLFCSLSIPVLAFTMEYGLFIGALSLIPMVLLIVLGIFQGQFSGVSSQFIFLVVNGLALAIIGTYKHNEEYYNRKISRLLIKDELTGLYNRHFLKMNVLEKIKLRTRFSLVILDVNYFKYYNDRWGHPRGDLLLIYLSRILGKSVRQEDIVIRYSGDEYIILMPLANESIIEEIIDRINNAIEEKHLPGAECFPSHKLTISFGFVNYPDDATTYENLLIAADRALYRYKNRDIKPSLLI